MRDVIIAPSRDYSRGADQAPTFLAAYAARVDWDDRQATPEVASSRTNPGPRTALGPNATSVARGRIQTQTIMASYVNKPSPLTADAVLAETFEAFERAVGWAGQGGRLAVGLGHGVTTAGQLYLAMAPLRFFPAHRNHFVRAASALNAQGDVPELDRGSLLLRRVGRLLRDGGIVRVDFLSCDIGVGAAGRTLLQAAADAFGCEVRGLRGALQIVLDPALGHLGASALVEPPGSSCTAPRSRHPRPPYCTPFSTLPLDSRLWLSAHSLSTPPSTSRRRP